MAAVADSGREVRRLGKDDNLARTVFLNKAGLFLADSALIMSQCHIQLMLGYHPANQLEVRGAAVKLNPMRSGTIYGEAMRRRIITRNRGISANTQHSLHPLVGRNTRC